LDYRKTVFLPKTEFPLRANLPEREPAILARWEEQDLYARQRAAATGREKFILHDGPPYANGNLHIGHALNKILKDVINRSQQMLGRDANYVPGWDCHGLPIEWKIEEEYRARGRDKDAVPILEFRRECRDFASRWIDIQREEFKRLGVIGDWANPYSTMSFAAEAAIVRELGRFLMNGGLYKGAKPVMWSVVEKTALAEAEIEYHDHTSTQIWVRFPVVRTADAALAPDVLAPDARTPAAVVIWTTTPWTIPGNRAVAYGEDIDYVLIEVESVGTESRARPGERLFVAEALRAAFADAVGITGHRVLASRTGAALAGTVCAHPLYAEGYGFDVPLLPGAHVTTEAGTGFVHTAPGHGAEDFEVGRIFGLDVPQTVADDGRFYDHVPLFAGEHVFKVDGHVADALAAAGTLLARGKLVHSYPHSWRSRAPLIFRTTPQWFIGMETNGLRDKALAAIDATRWVPATGRNRIRAMVETRPDWCVSRQRAWGVPITVFVDKESGAPLRDPAVLDRIIAAIARDGADAWFAEDAATFLGEGHDPDRYEKVTDILDVWFDSGSTHAFVLEQRPDLRWPASLYLEGSDQHRGWFHSSLLEACGTRGRAPYDAVLTHGFVLDEDGRKMSKSLGNVVAPQEVVGRLGADVLRLWVVSSDYAEDLRIGPEILRQQTDVYRRVRNTLRYLLGNLDGFTAAERVPVAAMPELERWVLHRLWELDRTVRQGCDAFDYHGLFTALHNFCAVDLSAFYFDVRKDSLYCDRPDSPRRRAARTVLDQLFSCLVTWLAPILCFTAEEAWGHRHPDPQSSVHLALFPEIPPAWRDDRLAERWAALRRMRRVITGAIERARAQGRLGASLQAAPVVHVDPVYAQAARGADLAEIAITSGIVLQVGEGPADAFRLPDVPGVAVVVAAAPGAKCARCWMVLPDVGKIPAHPALCGRCCDAVDHHGGAVHAAGG